MMVRLNTGYSRWILVRMLLMFGLLSVAFLYSWQFIQEFYFGNQLTKTGLIINAGILVLFVLGFIKIIATLLVYAHEESALAKFVRQLDTKKNDPVDGVGRRTLIAQRFEMMQSLHSQETPINHSALAATLVANESSRIGFVRFINNILILTGVFGTIVSLSIALLGASELFESVENIGNMGLVVHGMSAALSTTMTAIVCYLVFGYFYYKLSDAQTQLVSGIEQVTTYHLMPRFLSGSDRLNQNIGQLVAQLRLAAEGLVATQTTQENLGSTLKHVVNSLDTRVNRMSDDIETVKRLLREGFRLPPETRRPVETDHDE